MRNLTFIPNMGRSQKWSSFEMASSSSLFTFFRWFNSWGNVRTLLVWSCTETPAEVRRHFLQSRFVDASNSFLLFFTSACVCWHFFDSDPLTRSSRQAFVFVWVKYFQSLFDTLVCRSLSQVPSTHISPNCWKWAPASLILLIWLSVPGLHHIYFKMSSIAASLILVIDYTWFAGAPKTKVRHDKPENKSVTIEVSWCSFIQHCQAVTFHIWEQWCKLLMNFSQI